jgi:hypothetical protein
MSLVLLEIEYSEKYIFMVSIDYCIVLIVFTSHVYFTKLRCKVRWLFQG